MKQIKVDGMFWFIINKIIGLKNRLYNILIFHRKDIFIRYPAKLSGIKYMKIGKNFSTGRFLILEAIYNYNETNYNPQLIIKDNVRINESIHIGCTNYIEIGNSVTIGSKSFISDHNHGIYIGEKQTSPLIRPALRELTCDAKVIVGDNTWIGENVAILPNVSIGKGCIIGAGSIVTRDIPDYSIAVGNPAKVVKRFNFKTQKWEKVR